MGESDRDEAEWVVNAGKLVDFGSNLGCAAKRECGLLLLLPLLLLLLLLLLDMGQTTEEKKKAESEWLDG